MPRATERARDHLSILTDTFLLFLGVLRERFTLPKFYLSKFTVLSEPLCVFAFLFFIAEGLVLMSSVVFLLFLPVANIFGEISKFRLYLASP